MTDWPFRLVVTRAVVCVSGTRRLQCREDDLAPCAPKMLETQSAVSSWVQRAASIRLTVAAGSNRLGDQFSYRAGRLRLGDALLSHPSVGAHNMVAVICQSFRSFTSSLSIRDRALCRTGWLPSLAGHYNFPRVDWVELRAG
jgi:hypothetical protein